MSSLRTLLFITVTQILLTLVGGVLWPEHWVSISLGSTISLVNLWVLALVWLFIFYKKRVAPSVSVVVIKYGILILIFSQIPHVRWIDSNMFVLGILINPLALFLGGVLEKLIRSSNSQK